MERQGRMKRFILIFISLAMVIGCLSGACFAEDETTPVLKVLYIPIDDRPYNDERIQLMAQSLDVELIMPDKSLYTTVLDGQSEDGCHGGDRGALLEWLMEHQDSADVVLLSLDQLLSGGLICSRCISEMIPIELSNGTSMSELEVIDYLGELAATKQVYIVDSVQRLASSVGYGSYTIQDYNITYQYGMLERPVLEGEALTIENIISNYRLAADGTPAYLHCGFTEEELAYLLRDRTAQNEDASEGESASEDDSQSVMGYLQRMEPESKAVACDSAPENKKDYEESPKSLLAEYLAVRERKLTLTSYALETLTPLENVHYILGVDDSKAGEQIQSNELRYFETFMDDDDQIFSALDGLGQLALAHAYRSAVEAEPVGVRIAYFGADKDSIGAFSFKTRGENIEQVLSYYGCYEDGEAGKIDILVYSDEGTDETRKENLCDLVSRLNENEMDQIPTILIDVSGGEHALMSELPVDVVHLGALLSYSGRVDAPGQIHMALNQGLARYAAIENGEALSEKANKKHLENLLGAFVEEIYDTSDLLTDMYTFIEELGQSDPLQGVTEEQLAEIYTYFNQQAKTYLQPVLDSFTESNFVLSLETYTVAGVTTATISDLYYPWLRQFEIWGNYTCDYSVQPNDYGETHRRTVQGGGWTKCWPDMQITREQAAKMLVMYTQESVQEGLECPFTDISDWAKDQVAFAVQRGYMRGGGDGTFQGTRNMSRAEFVTMLYQFVEAEGIELEEQEKMTFSDVEETGAWYSEAVYTLSSCGIVKGFIDGTFRPQDEISRAEAVVMFARLFERTDTLPESVMSIQRYADVPLDYWAFAELQEASISHFCKNS